MKFIKNIRKYIVISGIVFLLIIALFAAATALIHKPDVQQYLLQKVCLGYGLETKTGKMKLDIFGASGVMVNDVEICRMDKSCSVTASSLTINFSKMRLLTGELVPKSIDIKHPVITVSETSIRSLYNKKKGSGSRRMPILCSDGVNRFNIEDGEILIDGPSGITVNNISAKLEHVKGTSSTYKIAGTGKVRYKGQQSVINTKTTIDVNPEDILDSVFSAALKTENTPLVWIPESSRKIDFKKGHVSMDLNILGNPLDGISLGGSLKFKSTAFTLFHKGRSKSYDIPEANGIINASIKDRGIHIESLNMKTRDLDINLDMTIDLTDRHNPDFRLNAKSNYMSIETFRRNFPFQITKPWLKEKLFPLFEEGMVRMDNLVLNGTMDQFRHIRDKENRSVIGMHLTCDSFILSNMGIQIPVTGVSASVDISDGNLKIAGLGGEFGDSEIKEWSVDVDSMIGGHPVFTVFVDGDFDIHELMSHRKLNVIPKTARALIEKYSKLNGRLSARTTIGYKKSWRAPRILSGEYSFRYARYHKSYLGLPLRFAQIDFHFPGDGDNTFSGHGAFGNTQFEVTGITEISGNRILFKHADITANADVTQLIRSCLESGRSPYIFREYLPVKISIDRQEEEYTYKGILDAEKLVMESDWVILHAAGEGSGVSFDIVQHGEDYLDLKSVKFILGKSSIFLSGQYSLTDKKLNALRITSRDLSIGDLGIQFKGTDNVLFGNLSGRLDFDFPEKNIKGMQINGNLVGDNISFIPGILPLPVSGCSFRLDLSGNKGFINQFDMTFGAHPLRIKGVLRGWESLKGDLIVTSDYIDLTEIIMNRSRVSAHKVKFRGKTFFDAYDINMQLNSKKGIWRKLEFKRLNAEIKFSDDNITIKNAQAELEKGDVAVDGIIGRRSENKVDINGRIRLDKQPIDKLISDTGFGDKGIKGSITFKSSVNIKGNRSEGILKNLSGSINEMSAKEGLIKNSRVFIKLLDVLNIPDKFRERPPELQEEGFYYKSIEGKGIIEDGIFKTDEFVIKSPVFNAVGSGEENLYKQTHNIRLLIQPLTNLDYIIHKVPFVGPIISDDNETIFTVGYDVKGSWKEPDLDLVPIENLKSLGGVLKRAILTPFRIIKKISNGIKKKKPKPEDMEDMNGATEPEKP